MGIVNRHVPIADCERSRWSTLIFIGGIVNRHVSIADYECSRWSTLVFICVTCTYVLLRLRFTWVTAYQKSHLKRFFFVRAKGYLERRNLNMKHINFDRNSEKKNCIPNRIIAFTLWYIKNYFFQNLKLLQMYILHFQSSIM